MTRKSPYIAVLGILLGACSSVGSAPPSAPQPILEFDVVSMQRTACYGQCPIYRVEIHADGRVTYTGVDFVKVKGLRESRIAPDDVARISAALRKVKFAQLREKYQVEGDGCGKMATDFSSVLFAVTAAGKTKNVAFYTGCRGPAIPAEDLVGLAQAIDAIAGTAELVKR